MKDLKNLRTLYKKNTKKIIDDYLTFLRFQTISSDPAYKDQMELCAKWLKNQIENFGMKAELWKSGRAPIVFASYEKAGKDEPTLLIYKHYDVQPVDPLSEWNSPPFDPKIISKNVFARGASDNKGQCFYVMQALKTLLEINQSLPINVKWIIDGEEECGSESLSKLLFEKKKEIKADYLAIVDLGIKDAKTPSLTLGVRGLICLDIELQSPKSDLHSGSHGGIIYNPLQALVELLSKVKDEKGKVKIPGFYDDVEILSSKEKSLIDFSFDAKDYQKKFGMPNGGEDQYSPLERAWIRPTFEINGISGGYGGPGIKTVIPAKAMAKISCRLVPNQDPEKVSHLLKKFFENNAPEGFDVKVHIHAGGGRALRSHALSPINKAFAKSYSEVFNTPCKFVFEGASIPIVTKLAKASNAEVALVGMSLGTDQFHAPNEHFGLDRLEMGYLILARTLEILQKK